MQQLQQRNEIMQRTNNPPTFADLAKISLINKYGMTEQEWAVYDAEMSFGLLKLRSSFPTQSRNYSDREVDIMTAVWLEVFAETERGILSEAIVRFVSTDRKGFFPSPGQIMGVVEDIQAERKAKIEAERLERHREYLRQKRIRIDNGENCATCLFCVCRQEKSMWDNSIEDNLYCQNPDSDKYEGDTNHKWGTIADYLCDFYVADNENK
jgi:hypothetical protein